MSHYKYTKTWLIHCELKYNLVNFLDSSKENNILEIGCYEGLSSVFFADKFIDNPHSSLTCVDPFLTIDNNDHGYLLQNGQELNFDYNISNCKNTDKIIIHKTTSDNFFENNNKIYNFIYIDGCHECEFVKRDMENSFKYLDKGGIIWMDYNRCITDNSENIKKIIDDFLEIYIGQYELIHIGYQLAIRKC
jgi:predicted O-methyltransferase YrrM